MWCLYIIIDFLFAYNDMNYSYVNKHKISEICISICEYKDIYGYQLCQQFNQNVYLL